MGKIIFNFNGNLHSFIVNALSSQKEVRVNYSFQLLNKKMRFDFQKFTSLFNIFVIYKTGKQNFKRVRMNFFLFLLREKGKRK